MAFIQSIPAAAPGASGEAATGPALDVVFIEGLCVQTVIGIDPEEQHVPQPLLLDLAVGLPHVAACDSDRIGDTIHYGVLRERVLQLLREHRLKLLEALAEAVCELALREFGAAWVRVKLAKPRKFDDVVAVGVQIERHAGHRPAAGLRLIDGAAAPAAR